MDKQKNTPIELMAQLLAEMTERAMNAERERDAERENSNEWYRSYKTKSEELTKTKAELEATKAELEATKAELEATKAELEHKKQLLEETEKDLKLLVCNNPDLGSIKKEALDNA